MDILGLIALVRSKGGGSGGTTNYNQLTNKPSINNVQLSGNKTAHDLGLAAQTDIPTVPVQSVNGKTGAVNLTSGDIAYDESAAYQSGTAGYALNDLNRQLSDVEENQIPELKNAISQLKALLLNDLIPILYAGVYTSDQSTAIAAFAAALSGGGGSITPSYSSGTLTLSGFEGTPGWSIT